MNKVPSSNISTPIQISPSPLQSTKTINSPNLSFTQTSKQNTPQFEELTTNAIQELKNLELLPLIMDLIEDVNTGKILPKDITNHSKNLIQIKINKARDILMCISGLSETPEERFIRMKKLQKNIINKNKSLNLFKSLVIEKLETK